MKYLKSFKTLKQYDDKKQRLSKPIISFCKENKALYYAWKELNPTPEEFKFRKTAGEIRDIEKSVARITKMKGNSVVWNMLSQPFPNTYTRSVSGVDVTTLQDTYIIKCNGTINEESAGNEIYVDSSIYPKPQGIVGHKYMFMVEGCKQLQVRVYRFATAIPFDNKGAIISCTNDELIRYSIFIPTSAPIGAVIDEEIKVRFTDLTRMFGAGNEPTTIEDFYARIPQGIEPYVYNEGEIVNMNVDAIKTTGFNQWDEQWEFGTIVGSTGENSASSTNIRSANFCRVLPNTEYYFKCPASAIMTIVCYDENKHFTHYLAWGEKLLNPIRKTQSNDYYMRIATYKDYGGTYNHDICVNISHTGYKNGTYEPYETFTRDISWVKKYFPNGMKSAGNVRDEIRFDSSLQKWVAVQNVGSVVMNSLEWGFAEIADTRPLGAFYAFVEKRASGMNNVLCSKYNTQKLSFHADNECFGNASNSLIYIIDSSHNGNISEFVKGLQGVTLNYELTTPIEYIIEEEIENSYTVWDLGTEEAISETPSTIFNGDIIYKYKPE